ncbi:MAG TPA: T9SS type A sorting domain-containing protein [Bacteroidales bacterium]|jgi:hypothetical protein|nr:T9SS type A sorting domain-containing protein [Bacteroidales bacterium]HRS68940.1 T9SS type A sorting domain-containing protein [Bacteroidales bacterium]HRT72117.1 T9SS type A sorting domain-containing protein [Bacteroidales bacterium]
MKRILIFGLIILGILVNISAQDKIIAPTPLLPANSSSNLNVKFNIDWTSVSGAVSYELQLDTNSAFTAPVTIQTMYSAYTINNLMYGTTYYWRVRAKNATNQFSAWSDVWNFTTKGLVSLRKPLDSANHVPLKLAIKWDTISGSMYRIQVDTTANFNSTMLSEFSAITADSVSLNRLLYNQKYFWRVMAYHQNDSADWSLTRLFTTKSNLDITPKFPVNNYTDFIPGDVIKAYAIWGSNGGELLLSEDSSFDVQFYYAFDSTDIIITKIQNTPPKYDTTVNVTTGYLKFNQNCYWKMRFFHSSDTSEWSPVYKFKTLDKVKLLTPIDNATDVNPLTGSLQWSSIYAADEYVIYYDTLSDLSTAKSVSVDPADTLYNKGDKIVYNLQNLNLSYSKTYYWQIKAKHVRDEATSDIRSFTTMHDNGVADYNGYSFAILPNPASDFVKINFNKEQTGMISIKNILGQDVYKEKINKTLNANIPVYNLDNGIYIIEFNSNDTYFSKKLIVKH